MKYLLLKKFLCSKKKARKDPQNPMSKGQILLMNPEVQEDFH